MSFRALLVLLLLALLAPAGDAQTTLLDTGFRQMYNLEFDQAHRSFAEWQRQHPEDPMGPVSDAAAYLFSEFDRLHILESEFFMHDENFTSRQKLSADPALKQKFLGALQTGQQLAGRILADNPNDQNALFASLLGTGIQADYTALIEKRNMAALGEVKRARSIAQKLLALNPNLADAYLAIGVENYLLSLRPAPVRWLLRLGGAQTDKAHGINSLQLTANKGHYLPPYARVLLAVAALRDKNVSGARALLRALAREFPQNRLYAQELARLQ